MKISKPWIYIITTSFFQLIQVLTTTDARSLQNGKLYKRQFSTNAVSLGQAFVQDNASPPRAALAQTSGNPGDKSTEFQGTGKYRNAGCYKDTETRAIPLLEGSDPELTGFYKVRQDSITKCASVARSRGYQLFAIQNDGMCLSGPKAHDTYKIHGLARNCKDGKGGPWASDVYIFNDFPLEIHIFTGTMPKAGTDANVYVTLTGSMGTSRRVALTPESADHNPFEAGQKDVFKVNTIPLGSISGITIGHDDAGQGTAGWFLEKVVVKDAANNMYKFQVNRWLAKDEDDGQIERELLLTSTISPGSYKPLGCFKERTDVNKDRSVPSLEGRDEVLDGQGTVAYRGREFPVEKCADAARKRGYVMFAIQDGGLCATSKEIQNTYNIYGEGQDCFINGTGSTFSSTVYTFTDQEPGFKDAEGTATAVAKETNSITSQPLPPSDPAMQLAGQTPPAAQQTGNPATANQQPEPAKTSTTGGKPAIPSSEGTPGKIASVNVGIAGKAESVKGSKETTKTDSKGGTGTATKPQTTSGNENQGKSSTGAGTTAAKPEVKPTKEATKAESGASESSKNDSATGKPESGTAKPDPSAGKAESGESKEKGETPTKKPDENTGKEGQASWKGKEEEKSKSKENEKEKGKTEEKEKEDKSKVKPNQEDSQEKTKEISLLASKGNAAASPIVQLRPSNLNSASTGSAGANPITQSTPESAGKGSERASAVTQPTLESAGKGSEGTNPAVQSNPKNAQLAGKVNEGTSSITQLTPNNINTVLQQPKTYPSREDTKIPTPSDKPGGVSSLLEAPVAPRIHKIAPETRLPGEFTSPGVADNKAIVKTATPMSPQSMPFSKLLLDARRQEGNHEFFRR